MSNSNDFLNRYIDVVNSSEASAKERFEKSLLTLSTGAFGVSISLLSTKDMNKFNLTLLIISWVSFGITIVLSMISYFVLLSGLKYSLKKTEKYLNDSSCEEYPDRDNNPYNTALYVISWISCLAFLSGMILTASFIYSGI